MVSSVVSVGIDAVALWESLVVECESLSAIGLCEYSPLPQLQSRVWLTDLEQQTIAVARRLAEESGMPFWDAVMLSGLQRDQLTDNLLDAATILNPPEIVPIRFTRADVAGGKLRSHIDQAGNKAFAVLSEVEWHGGVTAHIPMLDFRCPVGAANTAIAIRIAQRLLGGGGILLHSGRSYHLVGQEPMTTEELLRFLSLSLCFVPIVDRMYVAHHLLRRKCTLRVSGHPSSMAMPSVVAVF